MARRLGIGDFAKAFNSTYDLADKVAQDFEVTKTLNEKPEDGFGLSTDQNEQVFQTLADGGTAKDVRNDDGSFGGVAVSKPMADGIEGPAPAQTLKPQKVTTYLGREFVGGLDPSKVAGLRNRELAKIITRSDPIQGMKLDALLTQDERSDQDYADKQKVRGLQQQYFAEKDPMKRLALGQQMAALPGGFEVARGLGDVHKANQNAVMNLTRSRLANGDVQGAMDIYNHYDNGEHGTVKQLDGGGFQLDFYQGKPEDGKLSGSRTFKNINGVRDWVEDVFDPEAAEKRQAKAAEKLNELGLWKTKQDYQDNNQLSRQLEVEKFKAGLRSQPLSRGYKWEIDQAGQPTGRQIPDINSTGRLGGIKGAGLPTGQMDRMLAKEFTTKDELTGNRSLNTSAIMAARALTLATKEAASGDEVGAALQGINRYKMVLERVGGDHAKAAQLVQQMLQQPGRPPASGSSLPAPGARPPAATTTSPFQSSGNGGVGLSAEAFRRIQRREAQSVDNTLMK